MSKARENRIKLSHKFRLYPSKDKEQRLLKTLDLCRWTYNYFLAQWQDKDKIPNRYELQAQLPKLKAKKPELNNVYSKLLQMVLYQLYSNLKTLSQLKKKGKKVGKLRLKGKGWYKTLNFNQSGFKLIKTNNRLNKLHLSKIGDVLIRQHRPIKGKIKGVIIKRYKTGKWYAIFQVDTKSKPLSKNDKTIGLDMGTKHYLTDSNGRKIENPRFYEKTLHRIKKLQKDLSRKDKGSQNYKKAKKKLALSYEKLLNLRNDFLHKLSTFYVRNYGLIAIEDLNIYNMTKNHNLAQSILDASWKKFFQFLSYKAERAGRIIVKVDPKGTSKEYHHGKLDRDYNASLNILKRGLAKVGKGQADVKPVETEPLPIRASSVLEAGSSFLTSKAS